VNGQLVLEKGKHTGAKPGRALRHKSTRCAKRMPSRLIVSLSKPAPWRAYV